MTDHHRWGGGLRRHLSLSLSLSRRVSSVGPSRPGGARVRPNSAADRYEQHDETNPVGCPVPTTFVSFFCFFLPNRRRRDALYLSRNTYTHAHAHHAVTIGRWPSERTCPGDVTRAGRNDQYNPPRRHEFSKFHETRSGILAVVVRKSRFGRGR